MTGIRAAGYRSDNDFGDDEARALNIQKAPVLRDPRQS
jgi:hypothetical protein